MPAFAATTRLARPLPCYVSRASDSSKKEAEISRQGAVLLALALLLDAGGTLATAVIGPSGIDPRLQWEAGLTRGDRPGITTSTSN